MSLPHCWFPYVTESSELVAEADTGIDVRGTVARGWVGGTGGASDVGAEETVGQTAINLRPHHADIHVHMLGETPIDYCRDGVQGARATAGQRSQDGAVRNVRGGDREVVLPLVIVRTSDVQARADR